MEPSVKSYSDQKLVEEYIKYKNQDAFAEVFERYFDDVYRFIYAKVGKKEWAEDLTSETFIVLLKSIDKFDHSSKLKSFIIGIAVNKIRQFWQKKYKDKEEILYEDQIVCLENDDEISIEDEEKREHLLAMLDQVLEKLPENYRHVLTERFINELNIKQTAQKLKISEENVRVMQYRALKKAAEIGGELIK
jgi:RNA polymerase sigma-70 factor (ECF subfamily)